MEQLLEDYKRRLEGLKFLLNKETEQRKPDINRINRLNTKASCYRTFIAELEKAIAEKE